MALQSFLPTSSDAVGLAYTPLAATSEELTEPDPEYADGKWYYKKPMDELLAVMRAALADAAYLQAYTCASGDAVGDAVQLTGNTTVAKALGTVNAPVFGFIRHKGPLNAASVGASTTCYIVQFKKTTGLSGGTAGSAVYITNAGGYSSTAGTYSIRAGTWISTTEAVLFGSPLGSTLDGSALSVFGRASNTAGVMASIVAANDGEVVRRAGTTVGFGTVVAAGLESDSVITAKILDANVTTAKIADENVTLVKLEARARVHDNLIINGGFEFVQRIGTATVAMADGTYYADRWYALIQGANSTIERGSGDVGRYGASLVAGGVTNRFGIAQIVEASNSIPMRGRTFRAQARIIASKNAAAGSIDVRIAVLEWNGTADTVTRDVVNDWTSSTYTVANFFASSNLNLLGTAQISAPHNAYADISITGTVGSVSNNLIVFIWAEDVPAHAADIITISDVGLYDGTAKRDWIPRPNGQELALCQRYCWSVVTTIGFIAYGHGLATGAGSALLSRSLPVPMRQTPTLTATATDWVLSDDIAADIDVTTLTLSSVSTPEYVTFNAAVAASLIQARTYSLQADGISRTLILDAEL